MYADENMEQHKLLFVLGENVQNGTATSAVSLACFLQNQTYSHTIQQPRALIFNYLKKLSLF